MREYFIKMSSGGGDNDRNVAKYWELLSEMGRVGGDISLPIATPQISRQFDEIFYKIAKLWLLHCVTDIKYKAIRLTAEVWF